MKFSECTLVGFSESQMKRIRRTYKPDDEVGTNLMSGIADMTGYSVGLAINPGEPLKIVRLVKEV